MTQVDPPSTMTVFNVNGADCGAAELGSESEDYLLTRERDERSAAKQATSGVARSIHQELAQAYADLRRRVAR